MTRAPSFRIGDAPCGEKFPHDVLSVLRCPITGGKLLLANAQDAARISDDIAYGKLCHLRCPLQPGRFQSFLRTADFDVIYPILDGILVLLADLALVPTDTLKEFSGYVTSLASISVMSFYDEIGWKDAGGGRFRDAETNEDFRNASAAYLRDCHLRVNRYLPARGKYLVDIASGPIQYEEYFTYSSNFQYRICCDISLAALKSAKSRLGDRGVYIQCDITNIPLLDGAAEAFVSLHTIYHVPSERQALAFEELARITSPGGSGVVVYSWEGTPLLLRVFMSLPRAREIIDRFRHSLRSAVPDRVWRKLRTRAARSAPVGPVQSVAGRQSRAALYFHPHNYAWFAGSVAPRGGWSVATWRSISVEFLKRYIPDSVMGKILLKALFRLEDAYPSFFGRHGQYPLLRYTKG